VTREEVDNRQLKVEKEEKQLSHAKPVPPAEERYKHGPKTETPRLEPGRSNQQRYCTTAAIRVKSKE